MTTTKKEMDKNELMKKIIASVGKEKAVDLVMQSYNTELLSTHLRRLEAGAPGIGAYTRRDHLTDALKRVAEVCDLA